MKTFLYTYQSFATPQRLLKKLIERYNVVRPSGVSFKNFAVMKQTIQARVINAFKLWVDLSVDFKGTRSRPEDLFVVTTEDRKHAGNSFEQEEWGSGECIKE